MEIGGVTPDIFSLMASQPQQLETLSNNALSNGIDLFIKKDYAGAAREFQRSIGLSPQSEYAATSAEYLGKSYLKLGDTDKAIKAYRKATEIDLYNDGGYLNLGNLLFSLERFSEAEAEYEKAVRLNPDPVNRYALGQAYLNTGRYRDAEKQFQEILRVAPEGPSGNMGLGLTYSRQELYDNAILQFKEVIGKDEKFYDAYAELGYAYADSGRMDLAQEQFEFLEGVAPELADTLSRYMYKVDPPKLVFAWSNSTFTYNLPPRMPVAALDSYLVTPGATRTFKMVLQFDKEMDRASVENPANWRIGRATGSGPGQAYNFGLSIPSTEVSPSSIPQSVSYDAAKLTATVVFSIQQNASRDGTIDPGHIEFKFLGKDIFGNSMDPKADQFSGFSGVA